MERAWDSQGEVLLQVAAVPQKPRPQLHANDPENEEDEEAEEQHVAEHGQGVQQQVHQDAETCAREADGWLLITQCANHFLLLQEVIKRRIKSSCCQGASLKH